MSSDQDKSAITGDVAGMEKLKPLDLANVIRDAFLAGSGLDTASNVPTRIPDETLERLNSYDPEHVPAYRRLVAHMAALSALSARIAEAEWQPIETAPKTGEEIIARKDRYAAFSCFWYGGRWTHYDIEDGYIAYEPDEWMPFPTSEHAARFIEGVRDHG
jgi:hypothetical protein